MKLTQSVALVSTGIVVLAAVGISVLIEAGLMSVDTFTTVLGLVGGFAGVGGVGYALGERRGAAGQTIEYAELGGHGPAP